MKKSDRVRVHHRSDGVRVDHEKKSDGMRIHHEKKMMWSEFTMRKRAMG